MPSEGVIDSGEWLKDRRGAMVSDTVKENERSARLDYISDLSFFPWVRQPSRCLTS